MLPSALGMERRKTGNMSSPAGWYPQLDGQQRYWDGELWTERFAPGAPQTPASITNSISVDTMARPAYAAHGIWY